MHRNEIQAEKDLTLYTNWIYRVNEITNKAHYTIAPITNDRYFLFDLYQLKVVDTETGKTISTSIVELKERFYPIDKFKTAFTDYLKVKEMQKYAIEHNCDAYIVNIYKEDNTLAIFKIDKDVDYNDLKELKNVWMEINGEMGYGTKFIVEFPLDQAKKYPIEFDF